MLMRRRFQFRQSDPSLPLDSFATASLIVAVSVLLRACGSAPTAADATPAKRASASGNAVPVLPKAGSGRGGYYQDDGPGDRIPEGLLDTPDAEPRIEPFSPRANRPYVVFGKTYTPIANDKPFKQRGIGSWYGKKFHGQKTSSGEQYDMYKMTAAHPTLPIPSYARVTNLFNGKQVIVRVNDRGPFLSNRIIDLTFTAALKLGYLGKGSGELEVEQLLPDEIAKISAKRQAQPETAQLAQGAVTVEEIKPAEAVSVAATQQISALATDALPAAAPAQPVVAASASGIYLQVGAYSQAINAEAARAQIARNWAAGVPLPEVVQTGSLYRLQSGPFASRVEAEAAARQLKAPGGAKPVIVQR